MAGGGKNSARAPRTEQRGRTQAAGFSNRDSAALSTGRQGKPPKSAEPHRVSAGLSLRGRDPSGMAPLGLRQCQVIMGWFGQQPLWHALCPAACVPRCHLVLQRLLSVAAEAPDAAGRRLQQPRVSGEQPAATSHKTLPTPPGEGEGEPEQMVCQGELRHNLMPWQELGSHLSPPATCPGPPRWERC